MKDACRIAELCVQLGYPSSAIEVERRLGYILKNKNHALFVAEYTGGLVVGWAHVHQYALPYVELTADVGGVIVDENYRRQGIGRKLVASIEQWARENGGTVVIRSNVTRKESHRFYEAAGYIRIKDQSALIKPETG